MKNIAKIAFIVGILIAIFLHDKSSKNSRVPQYLYKIVSDATYSASLNKEHLELPEFDDAFIHLATKRQVPKIVEKFFADESDIHILKLDVKRLQGRLVKEKNPGGTVEYYHLYNGSIPKNSIVMEKGKINN